MVLGFSSSPPDSDHRHPHGAQVISSVTRWQHWWWTWLARSLPRHIVDGVSSGTAEQAYILRHYGLVQTTQEYPPGRYLVYTSQSGMVHVPTMLLPWFCVSSCILSYGCLLLLALFRRSLQVLSCIPTDVCMIHCAGSPRGGHGILYDDHTYILDLETSAPIEFLFTYPLLRFFSPEAPYVFVKKVILEKN
jgi:hypothetical protein